MEPYTNHIIICGQNSVQAQALVAMLSEHFDISHTSIDQYKKQEVHNNTLILIDVSGLSDINLNRFLSSLEEDSAIQATALINCPQIPDRKVLNQYSKLRGIFQESDALEYLIFGINTLLTKQYFLPISLMENLISNLPEETLSNQIRLKKLELTRREKQLLTLIKTGATNQEIADQLDLSENTIKTHLYNLYRKLQVRNRIEAIEWSRTYLSETVDVFAAAQALP